MPGPMVAWQGWGWGSAPVAVGQENLPHTQPCRRAISVPILQTLDLDHRGHEGKATWSGARCPHHPHTCAPPQPPMPVRRFGHQQRESLEAE